MEQKQKDIVYGYVRLNYGESIIRDIIEIIYQFYLMKIDSNILNSNEQILLLNLLFDALREQPRNTHIKTIEMKLLYRASENEYSARKFREFCEGKGPTITIIHNEHNHVFGGYTSQSWKWTSGFHSYPDLNAFLFMIRPKCKYFGLKENSSHDKVIYTTDGNGPTFGNGWDIYIGDKCRDQNGGVAHTFTQTSQEMCGGNVESEELNHMYKIFDYEVFSVTAT